MCSSAAKRSTNNQYVCKYIGRINDQSNWFGPFSLVVMMLDYRSRVPGSIPGRGTRRNIFFTGLFLLLLHVVPGARMTTVEAQGRCNGNGVTKEPGNSLIQMFHCRMEECSSAAVQIINMYVNI